MLEGNAGSFFVNPVVSREKFEELLLNDMWLGGDEEIKNDDEMFLAVGAEISEIVKIKKAQLVNC